MRGRAFRIGTAAWLAVCLAPGSSTEAGRRPGDEGVVLLWSSLPGIARGQTLRATVGNLLVPGREPIAAEVRARVSLFDANGDVLARTDLVPIAGGGLSRFDFERAAIPTVGDPATGRLQVRAQVEVHCAGVSKVDAFAIKQKVSAYFPVSLETYSSASGRTRAAVRTFILYDSFPPTLEPPGSSNPALFTVGIAPGETARFTLFLADGTPTRGAGLLPHPVRVTLLDEQGSVLVPPREVRMLPGRFQSLDFARDDLAVAGEPVTGRLQVWLRIERVQPWPSAEGAPRPAHGALEVVDNASGETTVSHPDFLWWPAG